MAPSINPMQWIVFADGKKGYRVGQVVGAYTNLEGEWMYRIDKAYETAAFIEESLVHRVLINDKWKDFVPTPST